MELSDSDKANILLNLLEEQGTQIERREETEQRWFEWSTGLLLASFGGAIALSNRDTPLPYSTIIKSVATALIAIPALISVIRILRPRIGMANNAGAIERIEQLLHLFDDGVYGSQSPYPKEWAGSLVKRVLGRRTPLYYSFILLLMTVCVVAAIWLVL